MKKIMLMVAACAAMVACNNGKTRNIKGDDGLIYAVKYLENGYQITKP